MGGVDRGRPINVSVRIGRSPALVATCDIPRPDAVVGLGDRFGRIPEPCGFQVDVPLPASGPGTQKLTIDIDDGEFGMTPPAPGRGRGTDVVLHARHLPFDLGRGRGRRRQRQAASG